MQQLSWNLREGSAVELCGQARGEQPSERGVVIPDEAGVEFLKPSLGVKSPDRSTRKGIACGVSEEQQWLRSYLYSGSMFSKGRETGFFSIDEQNVNTIKTAARSITTLIIEASDLEPRPQEIGYFIKKGMPKVIFIKA